MTSPFRMNRFPKGCDADHSNYVSIFINQVSGPPVWVKYAISLLESQSVHRSPFVHNTRRGSVQFVVDRRSSSRGISVSDLTRHENWICQCCNVCKKISWKCRGIKNQCNLMLQWFHEFCFFTRLEKVYIARSHHGPWGCTTSWWGLAYPLRPWSRVPWCQFCRRHWC